MIKNNQNQTKNKHTYTNMDVRTLGKLYIRERREKIYLLKSSPKTRTMCSPIKQWVLYHTIMNENTKYHNFLQRFGVKYLYILQHTSDLFIDPSRYVAALFADIRSQRSSLFDFCRNSKVSERRVERVERTESWHWPC